MEFKPCSGYGDNEFPAKVPWWWTTGPFWSSWFNLGDCFANFFITLILTLFVVPGGFGLSIEVHPLWWIPTIIVITWLLSNLYVFIITLGRQEITGSESNALAIKQYHELPPKIRRKLRKLAKSVDGNGYQYQEKFGQVVRGYHEDFVKPIKQNKTKYIKDELDIHLSTIKARHKAVTEVEREAQRLQAEALAEITKQYPIYK